MASSFSPLTLVAINYDFFEEIWLITPTPRQATIDDKLEFDVGFRRTQ